MLDVVLFGEFRVRSDGGLLTGLQSPRSQALIGYLAVHRGTPQARQQVANLFWPDSIEAQARTNLRRELHHVRSCLPEPDAVLAANQTSLWWRDDAPDQIDVAVFEAAVDQANAALGAGDKGTFVKHAEAAAAAYGGELLPALYDDWVMAERERLCRRCVALLDQLIQLGGGEDPDAVVAYARRRVELQPLEEVGHRILIDALTRAGDRAAALQAYHRCISVLDRELDVLPSSETTELYERLFSPGTHPEPVAPAVRKTTRFVGRVEELRALEDSWAVAATGAPGSARLVLISGEAGIGKSRLADELLAEVRHSGGVTALARCFAGERPLPLAPVSEWLRSDVCRRAVERLGPTWRAEVEHLVPELGGGPPPEVEPTEARNTEPLGDSWQRHRFFEGLVRAVLAIERPVALLLDDLQWCDLDTLTWLELCFRLGAEAPLLVVTTARSEEIYDNSDLVTTLGRLRAAGQVVDVPLGPLRENETAELARHLLGAGTATSSVTQLQALSGGFPLFVVEAARGQTRHGATAHLDALGSPRVHAVLQGRLSQLTPGASALAGLAAAVGRDFSFDLLAAASDLDRDRVVDALDELWHRRIVVEHSGGTYDFSHDLLRAAAYDSIGPPQRHRLHRRLAHALERLNAGASDAVSAQIADQYDRAGDWAKAIPAYHRAAHSAARMFAHQESIRLSERALGLLADMPAGRERDDQELLLRIASGGPRNALGGWASADVQENVEQIRDLAERTGDRPVLIESLVALWGVAFVQGRLTDALAIAERAQASQKDGATLQYGHVAIAGSLTSAGEPRRALRHFDLATSADGGAESGILGFGPTVMAWAWGAHACWLTGQVDLARERAATAIEVAEELALPWGRTVAVAYAAITHQMRGDRYETIARAQEVQELCTRYEFAYYQHWGEVLEGRMAGGNDGAGQIADAIRRLRELGVGSRLPYYLALLAETMLDVGRMREAATVLAEARDVAAQHADRWWLPELWRLEARLHQGPEGERQLDRAMTIADDQGSTSLGLRAAVDLAVRLHERGEADRASELVAPLRAACVGTSPELEAVDSRMDEFTSGYPEGAHPAPG
jgi:DNA-binding SARP family transcriptional activator/tetratricopeptide (TPR) repeat protein